MVDSIHWQSLLDMVRMSVGISTGNHHGRFDCLPHSWSEKLSGAVKGSMVATMRDQHHLVIFGTFTSSRDVAEIINGGWDLRDIFSRKKE